MAVWPSSHLMRQKDEASAARHNAGLKHGIEVFGALATRPRGSPHWSASRIALITAMARPRASPDSPSRPVPSPGSKPAFSAPGYLDGSLSRGGVPRRASVGRWNREQQPWSLSSGPLVLL